MSQNKQNTGVLWGRKLLILIIAIATALLVFFYFWILDIADATMRNELLQQARLVSKAINIERVKNLTGTESDTRSVDFIRLKEQLSLVRFTIPEYRYIYILGRNDNGDVFFFLDGAKKIPGEIYDDVPPGYVTIFETENADTQGPYTDKWGTFVSAGVPLVDTANGELVAVLGIDIDAKVWRRGMINRARWLLTGLVFVLAMLLALIIRLLYSLRQQRLSSMKIRAANEELKASSDALTKTLKELELAKDIAQQNEQMYRSLLLTVPDIIVRTDLQGTVTFLNDQAKKLMGDNYQGEIIGRNMFSFIAEEDVARAAENSRLMFEGPVGVKEYRINLDGSRYIHADINGEVLRDKNGNPTGMVYIIRDITERKMMEQERKQKELLEKKIAVAEESLRFKQNFLANMSHEIRTPLTGVLGMTDILEQTQLSENQKDYLNTIKTSGENLREIINQVLDFSKIEAGKIKINPVVFQFQTMLQNTEVIFNNIIKDGVTLTSHSDPDIPQYIKADRLRLSQVLNNLVSNALKFTQKGSVTIHSTIESSNKKNNQVVIKIEVADTGIGIPIAFQEKLFTPFSQIEVEDTRTYEGTGLGLSICKQLVGLIGGEIGVTSEEGTGSRFWFTFPATITSAPSIKKEGRTEQKTIPGLRILLAEDKIVNQKVITLMLNALGHQVEIANNGLLAVESFVPGQFDLILMDIQMPVMDGVTATQLLKEKYQNLPPIVGLSANAFEGDREKYMALGMDEYLTKPVKREDFEELMIKLNYKNN